VALPCHARLAAQIRLAAAMVLHRILSYHLANGSLAYRDRALLIFKMSG
jgi:hypothetical protein